jgi:uncharacterized protein (DUF433 family)
MALVTHPQDWTRISRHGDNYDNPAQCGGRLCIRGMRIRVSDELELFAAELSAEHIFEALPDLQRANLRALLQYAAQRIDHPVSRAA